ncbi:MAG TPA: hypothetical protein VNN22_25170 [Verrucomicrobiae bacterium]|nr:hypothetical protein [Verrucomicrobiae bacterium]
MSPYNWDFRAIPDSLLLAVAVAEYLPSWKEFRAAAVEWLQKKIDGRTVRDHIFDARNKNLSYFTGKVWESLPQKWITDFMRLERDCAYPVPFTWLIEKGFIVESKPKPPEPTVITVPGHPGKSLKLDTEKLHKEFAYRRLVGVQPMNKHKVEFISRMLSFPEVGESYGYHLEINFDLHRNEDLVKALGFWLGQEARKKRKIAVHGRDSSSKWHRLKQLAAKRLSDAGLHYKDALRTIAEREKAAPMDDYHEVLPKYNSQGAWLDAVKEANLIIEKMKHNFRFEDYELL